MQREQRKAQKPARYRDGSDNAEAIDVEIEEIDRVNRLDEASEKLARHLARDNDGIWKRCMELITRGALPILRSVTVTVEIAAKMADHGKTMRDLNLEPDGKRRRLDPQPHPLVFAFATELGLNTDDEKLVSHIMTMHHLPAVNTGTRAERIYAQNDCLEKYLAHREGEWEDASVWPARMKDSGAHNVGQMNGYRVNVLGELQKRLRKYLTLKDNVSLELPDSGSLNSVSMDCKLFTMMFGSAMVSAQFVAGGRRSEYVEMYVEDGSELDFPFPADSERPQQ
jgi:hypothetical protein